MKHKKTIYERLISAGYGIYNLPYGIVVAHPLGGVDGVYLECRSMADIEDSGLDFFGDEIFDSANEVAQL